MRYDRSMVKPVRLIVQVKLIKSGTNGEASHIARGHA